MSGNCSYGWHPVSTGGDKRVPSRNPEVYWEKLEGKDWGAQRKIHLGGGTSRSNMSKSVSETWI